MSKKARTNSNCKGKRGEREFAKELCKYVDQDGKRIEARRGQQRRGGPDSPDCIHSIPGVHFEVKRGESFRIGSVLLLAALRQATQERDDDARPVVAWRANRRRWLASMWSREFTSPPGCSLPIVTLTLHDFMLALGYRKEESNAD